MTFTIDDVLASVRGGELRSEANDLVVIPTTKKEHFYYLVNLTKKKDLIEGLKNHFDDFYSTIDDDFLS